MRQRERVFVDTGAWIALALTRDPMHTRAREIWEKLEQTGARLYTSVAVMLETFTFLDRNAQRDVALAWRDALDELKKLKILDCTRAELEQAWPYFQRSGFHKLSAVDATSFALMEKENLHVAFTFDHHFAVAGFRLAE